MKFTLSWLKDHLDTKADLKTILVRLSMLGLEVEGVENKGASLGAFTIARINTAAKHPGADKLQVCEVDTGAGVVEVVCGAPNARAGLVGVFAPVGSYVPGIDLTLTQAEIRGVVSNGMMCSEREMMLSDEHDGIIELAPDAPIGAGFAAWAGLDDPIIEIAITPNRADCLGVRGVARDLAAAGLGKLKPLADARVTATGASRIKWAIDLPQDKAYLCPRITGRSFSGVVNGPAPRWMRQRLEAVGQRPISRLVDITNYVMLDLGRPLHAYDIDKIKGDTLTIRLAREGEEIEALNEKTYRLDETMLVLADAEGADDLAGIMGGQRTGVSDETTALFLEVAIFDPVSVATTGRRLNIHSDARFRFERGLDVMAPDTLMDYISALVLDICGGEASDIAVAGEGADWHRHIAFDPLWVKKLTGLYIWPARQEKILKDLGFRVEKTARPWQVTPPPWRGDIDGAADLVEEVVRIYGYHKIPETPLPQLGIVAAVSAEGRRPYTVRRLLAGRGMMEAVTFSFLDHKTASDFGGGAEELRLINPISSDLDTMRPGIMPNLLAAAKRNVARGECDVAMFEIGPVFAGDDMEGQRTQVAGLRHGVITSHYWVILPRDWRIMSYAVDWMDAKADALAVLAALGVDTASLQTKAEAPEWYHPNKSGSLCQGRKVLAVFGSIRPEMINKFDLRGAARGSRHKTFPEALKQIHLRGAVAGFEITLEDIPLPRARGPAKPLANLSPFQPVMREFAFIIDEGVTAEALLRAIRGAGKALPRDVAVLADAAVFDVYSGAGIEAGHKSLAVAVTLQPVKATLKDEEIESISAAIIAAVAKHCGGSLRG